MPFSSRRLQTKPTATEARPDDDAILEAAIAQRNHALGHGEAYADGGAYADDPPSQTVSTVSWDPSSAHQTPLASREASFARPYPQHEGHLEVSIAGAAGHSNHPQHTSTKDVAGSVNEVASGESGPLSSFCGRVTVAFFSLLTLADLVLQVSFAFRVGSFYGGDRAESFWWIIMLGRIGSLLGITMLVSRVAAQQTPAGLGLQKRLDEKREATGVFLMACVVHPELLRCLLPGIEYALTVVKIDTIASLLAGVPFLFLSVSFAAEERFGDRYGLLQALGDVVSTQHEHDSARMLHDVISPPPSSPMPPPSAPPPPFPPTDPSGDTTILAIVAASWTCAVIGLKLIRLAIAWQTSSLTTELRQRVTSLQQELDAERKARAEENAELMSLREYYYGAAEGYAEQL